MSRITASTLVPIQHPTGLELTTQLTFEKKPTRLQVRLKTLQKYVEKYPSGWKKRLELADILYALGQWDQAIEQYRIVLDRQPYLLNVRLKLGKILQIRHQTTDAIALYTDALQYTNHDDDATRHHFNGLLYECHKQVTEATQAYRNSTDLEPQNPAHWFALAHVYSRQGATIDAIDTLAHILDLSPDNVSAHSQSADLLWSLGAYPEAMKHTERVLAIAPDHASALKGWLDHRCRTGLFQGDEGVKTTKALKQLQRLSPHAPETYQSQAYYYRYQGKIDNGNALLKQYCAEHPKNPFGLCYYAQFLIHVGDSPKALPIIEHAYQLYSDHIGICQVLCEALSKSRKQHDLPLKPYMEQILNRFPDQWSLVLPISKLFVESKQMSKRGWELAEIVLQQQSSLAEPWFLYGQMLQSSHDYSGAIAAMTTGWQLLSTQWFCATSIPAAIRIAQCYGSLGNDEQAQRWCNEGLARSHHLLPFFPALAHYWQGHAYIGLRQVQRAKEHFQIALKQHLPHHCVQDAMHHYQRL